MYILGTSSTLHNYFAQVISTFYHILSLDSNSFADSYIQQYPGGLLKAFSTWGCACLSISADISKSGLKPVRYSCLNYFHQNYQFPNRVPVQVSFFQNFIPVHGLNCSDSRIPVFFSKIDPQEYRKHISFFSSFIFVLIINTEFACSQTLLGNIGEASRTISRYHSVWRQFGFTPEFYQIGPGETFAGREGYPLRPGKTLISYLKGIAKTRVLCCRLFLFFMNFVQSSILEAVGSESLASRKACWSLDSL